MSLAPLDVPAAGATGADLSSSLHVQAAYGPRALAALVGELSHLAAETAAPLTARPGWSLSAGAASVSVRPWALVTRNAFGALVGAVVLADEVDGDGASRTVLAGTDGGHRGAVLASDPAVANVLGRSLGRAFAQRAEPVLARLGPLPAEDPITEAFAAGVPGAQVEEGPGIPVIRLPGSHLSAGTARTLRKAANRLAADGRAARTRTVRDPDAVLQLLPDLEQVHRHRDHVHGRISDLDDVVRHRTWRRRVRYLCDSGALELAVLEIDGALAAYTLGVVDGTVYRLLEGRFVTRWARYSPGRLLEAAVVERVASDAELTTFDWMTAVAPSSLLGSNAEDRMVMLRVGPAAAPAG